MKALLEWLLAPFRSPPKIVVSPEESAARVASVVAYMLERARPCLFVSTAVEPTLSRLGGLPSLAADQVLATLGWPTLELSRTH